MISDDHPELEPDCEDEPSEPRSEELFAARYSIIRTIGAGGMGKVFEAFDTRVGRTVALKLMRERARSRPSLVQRFHREYRAMARLHHPGVPQIFDAGLDDTGRAYYTMDIVYGEALLDSPALVRTPCERLALIRDVAQILVRVHEAGVIHRDIKPSNILIDPEGRAHLIDFGACSLVEDPEAEHPVAPQTNIRTAPGTWLGTLGYIDPAMLEGATCSARSDIYSLAATLSWMFTGQHPCADSLAAVPRTGIEAVDAVLQRGMARDPEERPATVADFAAELAAAEVALSDTHPSMSRASKAAEHLPSRNFSPALILALGVLGGALAGPIQSAAVTEVAPSGRTVQPIISLPLNRPEDETLIQPEPLLEPSEADEPQMENPQASTVPDIADSTRDRAQRPVKRARAHRTELGASERRTIDPGRIEQEVKPLLERCFRHASDSTMSLPVKIKILDGVGRLTESSRRETRDMELSACITGSLELLSFVGFPKQSQFALTLTRDQDVLDSNTK